MNINPFTHVVLPVTVRTQTALGRVRTKVLATWDERADETGLDEAVTKMIWLAVGIGVAVAATAFFVDVFNEAQTSVPDPVVAIP
jgi:hypothetical protein